MRVKLFLSTLFVVLANIVVAQSSWRVPQSFNYQMVVRDANDWIVRNQLIGLKVSIQNGTTPATTLYSETHSISTDLNGYLSINVGAGTPVHGRFDTISWGRYSNVLLYVQADIAGGTNYTLSATQQLAAVPFAFMADETQDFSDVLKNGNRAGMRQLKDLKDPTDPQDVLTKYYLDSVIADFLARQSFAIKHDTICLSAPSLPYEWRSRQLVATGIYYDTLAGRAEGGKDSLYALHLTVSDGTHNVVAHNDNSPYVWDRNGQTYTATGEYVYEYVDDNHCPSADTLKLTIALPSCAANSYMVQQKTPYLWPASGENGHGDGLTHDATGTYYGTIYNDNCVDTLYLTIIEDVYGAIDTFVCEGSYYDTLLYEGFESGIPATWSTKTGSGSSGWQVTVAVTIEGTYYSPFAGQKFAHEDGGNSEKNSFLYTPQINITDPENTYVQFHYMNSYWEDVSHSKYSNKVSLRYSLSKNGTYNQIWTSGTTTVQSTWYPANVSLQSMAAGQYYFAFVDYDGGGDCGAVDEVMILHRRVPAEVASTTAGSTVVTQKTLTASNGGDSIVDITWHILPNFVNNIDTAVLQSDFPTTWRGVSFAKAGVKEKRLSAANGCDSIVTMKVNVLVDDNRRFSVCHGQSTIQYYDTLLFEDFSSGSWSDGWEITTGGYIIQYDFYPTREWGIGNELTFDDLLLSSRDGSNAAFAWTKKYYYYGYYTGATTRFFTPTVNITDPANTTLSYVSRIWTINGNADELKVGFMPSGSTDIDDAYLLYHDDGTQAGWQERSLSLSSVPRGKWRFVFLDFDYWSALAVDNICVSVLRTLNIPDDAPQGLSYVNDTIHTAFGYDSIRRYSVMLGEGTSVNDAKTICSSQLPYTWNTKEFAAAGSQSATLLGSDGCDSVVNMTLSVTPSPLFAIIGDTCQAVCINSPITTVQLSATNAQDAFVTNGTLPAGVSYNSATKTIEGTPTAAGSYLFYVTANSNQTPACASTTQSIAINVGEPREVHRSYTVCQSDSCVASTEIGSLFFEDFDGENCLNDWDVRTELENYERPIDGWRRSLTQAYKGHSLVINNTVNSTVGDSYWGTSLATSPRVYIADPSNTYISFYILKTINFHNHGFFYGYYADQFELKLVDEDGVTRTVYVSDFNWKATVWTFQHVDLPSDLKPGYYNIVFHDYDMWGLTALDSIDVVGPLSIRVPNDLPLGDSETRDNLVAYDGCDSVVVTNWHVLPSFSSSEDKVIYENDLPYTYHGVEFTAESSKDLTLAATNGCDSVVTVNLSTLSTDIIVDREHTVQKEQAFSSQVINSTYASYVEIVGLPSGVTYNAETGYIEGTIATCGTYNCSIKICGTSTTDVVITVAE